MCGREILSQLRPPLGAKLGALAQESLFREPSGAAAAAHDKRIWYDEMRKVYHATSTKAEKSPTWLRNKSLEGRPKANSGLAGHSLELRCDDCERSDPAWHFCTGAFYENLVVFLEVDTGILLCRAVRDAERVSLDKTSRAR